MQNRRRYLTKLKDCKLKTNHAANLVEQLWWEILSRPCKPLVKFVMQESTAPEVDNLRFSSFQVQDNVLTLDITVENTSGMNVFHSRYNLNQICCQIDILQYLIVRMDTE